MQTAISAENEILGGFGIPFASAPHQAEREERIMDQADFAAASTQKRLTHEQVFDALRRSLHAE